LLRPLELAAYPDAATPGRYRDAASENTPPTELDGLGDLSPPEHSPIDRGFGLFEINGPLVQENGSELADGANRVTDRTRYREPLRHGGGTGAAAGPDPREPGQTVSRVAISSALESFVGDGMATVPSPWRQGTADDFRSGTIGSLFGEEGPMPGLQ